VVPPRPSLPDDDLYARLGVPTDASSEAIEIAWRGLLRRHHPDVAGDDALEAAKRINVAHDWLADPDLRARYDEARAPGRGSRGGRSVRDGRPPRGGAAAPVVRPRPPTQAERIASVVERVARLDRDELDRLALAEPAPIAFVATIRRFIDPDLVAVLDDADRRVRAALPPFARRRPGIRDAVVGRVAEIVLGDTLDELLGEPAGERARERLTRGWDAAVGQPRYGPATSTVGELLERLARLDEDGLRWLAATGGREQLGPAPWPPATSRDEDEALRVSTELAASDAEAAIAAAGGTASARRAAARVAHLVVLRHAFPAAAFGRLAAPWLGTLIATPQQARARVRRHA
jgi:curved DNA-binding protein CbpA